MYELERFMSKVVTIKLASGLELIAQMAGVAEDSGTITLFRPRVVVVADNEIAVVPYTFTSNDDTVPIALAHVLSVAASDEQSAAEYTQATTEEENQ